MSKNGNRFTKKGLRLSLPMGRGFSKKKKSIADLWVKRSEICTAASKSSKPTPKPIRKRGSWKPDALARNALISKECHAFLASLTRRVTIASLTRRITTSFANALGEPQLTLTPSLPPLNEAVRQRVLAKVFRVGVELNFTA